MRICLISHYFHPEIGAPSARLTSLAHELRTLGHDVTVLTGFPNHPTGRIPDGYRGMLVAVEDLAGVRVLRNWLYATPNEGFVRKTICHLSFMVSAVLLGGPRVGRVDVIVASSPTFFSVISAWCLSLLKQAPFVFEVRDLWPAVFVELGVLRNRLLIGILEAVEMFLYRRSAAVVTVTRSFERDLLRRGVPASKVETITNGVDLGAFSPGSPDEALRASLGLEGRFIVLYIGAHGISQALTAVLLTAGRLRDEPAPHFLFVGEGAEKKALEEKARDWGLHNVSFLPGQARDKVLAFYRTADLVLVPLRNIPLFDGFIPSKMFEVMGAGRPILASLRGEAAEILEASGAARIVAPEDDAAMAEAVMELIDDRDALARMGAAGRAFVETHYHRRGLASRYEALLRRVAGGPA